MPYSEKEPGTMRMVSLVGSILAVNNVSRRQLDRLQDVNGNVVRMI
jgi:hypothetical protein